MASIRNLKDNVGNVFYPLTHERAVKDSNGASLESKLAGLESKSYVEAWDGTSTPVEANIPDGVTVTYNTTTYTGTLEASASTIGKIYLVKNGNDYDRYITSQSGSAYSWAPVGSTEMDLSGYATDSELNQLEAELYGGTASVKLPTDGWMEQVPDTAYGSNTDKIYFDTRVVVDRDHKIKQFQIGRHAIGTIRVYFLKVADMSVVTYKEVSITDTVGIQTVDMVLEDEYYENGPMYVGIWSSITWRAISAYVPTTRAYIISTGEVDVVSPYSYLYGITVTETEEGDLSAIDNRVTTIEGELEGLYPKEIQPTDSWADGEFTVDGGGVSTLVYFDERNVLADGDTLKEIRVKTTSTGSVVLYLISPTNTVLGTQTILATGNDTTVKPSFNASLYGAGVKVGALTSTSILAMRSFQSGEISHTKKLDLTNDTVSDVYFALGMSIVVEKKGDLAEIPSEIDKLSKTVFEESVMPSSSWVEGSFTVLGGGSSDYAYIDDRTIIPNGAELEKVQMVGSGSGEITVYLLKADDFSVLASVQKEISIGINDITPSFGQSLFSVPTFIAIGSASSIIGMRDSFASEEESHTSRISFSTGTVTSHIQYIIGLDVTFKSAGFIEKSSRDLAVAIGQNGDDIVLGPYDYAVTSPITLRSGMTIRGSFGKTRLILTDGCQTAISVSNANNIKISDLEIVGTCPTYAYEMNGIVAGSGYDLVEDEDDAENLAYMGTEKGIYLYYAENVVLENIKINHIDGSAIRVNHTGRDYIKGLNASNLFITNCYNGIYTENEHEFSQYTNFEITLCMVGLYVTSGNLIFTAGHLTRCRVAVEYLGGYNHAHGVCNGLEIKHNQVAGIICKDIANGQQFTGCYVSYSNVIIRDSKGVTFDALTMGQGHIICSGNSGGIGGNYIITLFNRTGSVYITNTGNLVVQQNINLDSLPN